MDETDIDLRALLGLLRRRARLIALVFALVTGVAAIVTFALPPRYAASALVLVDPVRKDLLSPETASIGGGESARVDSEAEILRSDATLLDVVSSERLSRDPEFAPATGPAARILSSLGLADTAAPNADAATRSALSGLRRAVSVERRGLTYVIAVRVTAGTPGKAAQLANALADAYIARQVQAKTETMLASQGVLDARISEARTALVASEERLGTFLDTHLSDAGVQPAALPARLEARLPELSTETLARAYELQQSAELARTQYETLRQRSADLGVQARLQVADARIVSRALPAERPSFPDIPFILALADLGGLSCGLGMAVVYDRFIGGFTSDAQLAAAMRVPGAIDVPVQKPNANGGTLADRVLSAPLSFYSESIRKIRARIDQLAPLPSGSARGTVIVVASAVPGEGKTTLALSLARTYAVSGRKTIVIDCDLRKPSIHSQLSLEPHAELLDFLTGSVDADALSRVIAHDAGTGLSILASARRSDAPTDQLLTSTTFEHLIAAAAQNFDVVILDTPPINPVVDGLYAARYADVIAFVVRWATTPQSEARQALARLAETRTDSRAMVGILNRNEAARTGFKNAYAAYYEDA